ncbi:hypothetical protein COLO4_36125 [Corchorus olitorius]|uniref:Uncharacterized protein n=1 Tax=Corchorus olitorius TaxID=93759 RepID=A0A1R3GAU2_9ROSI|nr:hypothetical protein COLO4_36125 [Corchorus olitorius]
MKLTSSSAIPIVVEFVKELFTPREELVVVEAVA